MACNCSSQTNGGKDGGVDNPPIEYDDAGNPTAKDGGSTGTIAVSCTQASPLGAVPVNTLVTIQCDIDSGGKSIGEPRLSASPPDGVELGNGAQPGVVNFSLSTGKAGYLHPKTFQDTTYRVTVEVRNSANAAEFGRGTVDVTVLGNYWVGDPASNGLGVLIFKSDGKYLSQAIGPAGITGVTDLYMMPSGDVAVSAREKKLIKIFDRTGVVRPITFSDTDKFAGSVKIWEPSGGYSSAGPERMALSSTGELWVAGAVEGTTWGLVVFNPVNGEVLRFLPNPETNNTFKFTSIARRTDGKILASSDQRRTVCIFDERTYASEGCFVVGDSFTGYLKVLYPMPNAQVLAGIKESTDAGLMLLGPTLATDLTSTKIYMPDVTGLVKSGNEVLAMGVFGNSCCNPQIARFDATTLTLKGTWDLDVAGSSFYNCSGLVRLAPPGK